MRQNGTTAAAIKMTSLPVLVTILLILLLLITSLWVTTVRPSHPQGAMGSGATVMSAPGDDLQPALVAGQRHVGPDNPEDTSRPLDQ